MTPIEGNIAVGYAAGYANSVGETKELKADVALNMRELVGNIIDDALHARSMAMSLRANVHGDFPCKDEAVSVNPNGLEGQIGYLASIINELRAELARIRV